MQQVRRAAQTLRPLLVVTDGWAAYPGSIRCAFREKVKKLAGVGRACLEVWPHLSIGTVIKRTQKKRVVEVTRQMAHGLLEQAEQLLELSHGGSVLNTAFIERLNGTFRERPASLTRKCRHAAARLQASHTGMYLIGCTYNFCWAHQELSKTKHWGRACTPAMASGLTDHIWSVCELLSYKVAPAPWIEPKRRGRPAKQAQPIVRPTTCQKPRSRLRPLVRLRKGVLCSTATIGQILFSAVPILTALASFLFIKERIGLRKIIGVSIGFLGTVFIILLPVIGKHTAFNGNLLGNMLVFISAICLAWYSVLSKKFHTHYSPLYLTALFIYLTALTNGLLAIPELLANYNFLNTIPFLGWIGVLYVGTFGILFFLLYQYAVKHGSPIIASTLNYLSPVVAFVVASILLGERLTGGFIAGALLALLGVYIVTVG